MTEQAIGVAHLGSGAGASIAPRIDGPVLTETLAAMQAGAGGSPLSQSVADDVKSQVTGVMGAILHAYETLVTPGEVGIGGTGRASKAPRLEESPTGLLYGRVQSGKTNAMIVLSAMAMDNGFRVVVVLTSDNVSLVKQTANRFQVLQGATVKDSTAIGSWLESPDHVKASLREGGLVLVTAKNSSHMDTFIAFLQDIGAGEYPALILDDEADQATLDTNVKKNTAKPKKGQVKPAPLPGSKIFEHHRSMRDELRHHVYLQVTATPYALWLQNTDHPLRPRFTKLLEPGQGYTGGHFFFSAEAVDEEKVPLVYVNPDEDDQLVDDQSRTPEGLERAIGYFLVAAAAQGLADPDSRFKQANFLCHTSFKKAEHKVAADRIRNHVLKIREALNAGALFADVALRQGLVELERSFDSVPSLDAVKEQLKWRLRNFEVFVINSESDELNPPPKLNFVVGGNILGRGMTIENLLVTYYLRSTKIAQMDTVLQHARMFGYRAKSRAYLRVFLPKLQALRFYRIQEAEDSLRELQHSGGVIPVRTTKDMRPTRTNVLDASHVIAYHPGEHLYPALPAYGPGAEAKHREVFEWVKSAFGVPLVEKDSHELMEVPLDLVIEAIQKIPYDVPSAGSWDVRSITEVLHTARDLFGNKAYFVTRKARRNHLTQGMISGNNLKDYRGMGAPVFGVFVDDSNRLNIGSKRNSGGPIELPFYIFPELVLPANGMPVHVFNDS